MKKLVFLSVVLLGTYFSNAQWETSGNNIYNTNSGNVGIRISTPVHPFQIWDGGTNIYSGFSLIPGNSPAEDATLRVLKTGPYGLFIKAMNEDNGKGQSAIYLNSSNGSNVPSQVTVMSNFIDLRTGTGYTDDITGKTFGTSALFINENQRIGIGTTSPGSYKLAVEGKIGAREIKVTLENPWADYVFNKNYQLRSLASLEKYINQYQHLPGLPSAAEVNKNGGIELGEMNRKLLEKVEELTLYIIEVNKKVEKLEKENEKLKAKNN